MNNIVKASEPNITKLRQEAELLIKGGAVTNDCKTVEQALMKIRTGFDMGLTPTQAMNFTYIVNGKVLPYGQGAPYLLRRHGYKLQYEDRPNECTAIVTRDGEEYSETVTFADAEASGYTEGTYNGKKYTKAGWKPGQNRKLKLRYLAVSTLIKTYIPEVLCGATDFVETFKDVDLDAPKKEIKQEQYNEFDQTKQEYETKETEIMEGELVEEIDQEMQNITLDALSEAMKGYINVMGEHGYDLEEALGKIQEYYKTDPRELSDKQVTDFHEAVIKKLAE
jgi:hypothetical protein